LYTPPGERGHVYPLWVPTHTHDPKNGSCHQTRAQKNLAGVGPPDCIFALYCIQYNALYAIQCVIYDLGRNPTRGVGEVRSMADITVPSSEPDPPPSPSSDANRFMRPRMISGRSFLIEWTTLVSK